MSTGQQLIHLRNHSQIATFMAQSIPGTWQISSTTVQNHLYQGNLILLYARQVDMVTTASEIYTEIVG